jgi:predicted HAD superfamily Cof-like phosphohydrolase
MPTPAQLERLTKVIEGLHGRLSAAMAQTPSGPIRDTMTEVIKNLKEQHAEVLTAGAQIRQNLTAAVEKAQEAKKQADATVAAKLAAKAAAQAPRATAVTPPAALHRDLADELRTLLWKEYPPLAEEIVEG